MVAFYQGKEVSVNFGEGCGLRMLDYIVNKLRHSDHVKWVAYNGSKFDNYLLRDAISNSSEVSLDSMFMKGNELISM